MEALTLRLESSARFPKAHPAILAASIVAVGLTAGCRGGEPDVDQIVSRVQAAQAEISATHSVSEVTLEMPGLEGLAGGALDTGPMSMSIEQWTDGDNMRMEFVDGPEAMKGTVMTVNGDKVAMYSSAANQFVETTLGEGGMGSSPAQTAAMTRQWVSQILSTNSVSLAGIEEIAGRRAYKLHAVPKSADDEASDTKDSADDNGSTLWVDAETFYPLKLDLSVGPMRMTLNTREIEYNPQVPSGIFELKAPAGAQTSDLELPKMEPVSVEDAEEQAGYSLLEPAAGATDFELQSTNVMNMPGPEGEISVVTQIYSGPLGAVTVQYMPGGSDFDLGAAMGGDSKTVDLGGREATLLSLGIAGSVLSWQEGDTHVTVSGQTGEEELLKFAESLR